MRGYSTLHPRMTQGRNRVKIPRVSFPASPRTPAFLPSVEATDPDLEGPVDPDDEYLHGNQHSLMTHCSNMLWSQDLPRTLVQEIKKTSRVGRGVYLRIRRSIAYLPDGL